MVPGERQKFFKKSTGGAKMKTKYSTVRSYIKNRLLDGTFQPNEKIESESELMKRFGVSRHTVRLAIGDLVTEGWLYREQGVGTFCADRSVGEEKRKSELIKKIAIITTYISDYIFPSIIRGAEAKLREKGYQVSLFSTNNNHENERTILEEILSQKFNGVIVEPTKSAFSNPNLTYYLNLERTEIPYIMINAYYDELEPINIVMDDEKGGFLLTEHLIKLGHKNIMGFFKTDDKQGTQRMKGFLQAHRQNNIPIDPSYLVTYETEDKHTKPVEELEKVLSGKNNPITGIVCYNDELAISLLEILRTKKMQIPSDISIVGHDDSFLAEVSEVKLTTIKHPKIEMGKAAANMIIDLVENGKGMESQSHSILYDPELIIRGSTKSLQNIHS